MQMLSSCCYDHLPSNGTLIDTLKKFKAYKLSQDMIPSDDFSAPVRSE